MAWCGSGNPMWLLRRLEHELFSSGDERTIRPGGFWPGRCDSKGIGFPSFQERRQCPRQKRSAIFIAQTHLATLCFYYEIGEWTKGHVHAVHRRHWATSPTLFVLGGRGAVRVQTMSLSVVLAVQELTVLVSLALNSNIFQDTSNVNTICVCIEYLTVCLLWIFFLYFYFFETESSV